MINLVILDDENIVLKEIHQHVKSNLQIEKSTKIFAFSSISAFMSELENGLKLNILVSDIEMGEMNGIELGSIIKEKYPDVYLIYLTSYAEFAYQSYEIDAFQYVLKEKMEEKLNAIILKAIETIHKENKRYRTIYFKGEVYKIYYKDIIQVNKIKNGKNVEFITSSGTYEERITLKDILADIEDQDFLRIDRSCIVNAQHICAIKKDSIKLSNNTEIMIGKIKANLLKREIHDRWRRK